MITTPLSNITLRTYWLGGVEGAATDWNHPDNWSTREVPSSISDVIIPNVAKEGRPFPVLRSAVRTIAHLEICKHAELYLTPEASLHIEGSRTYENGISIFGKLVNQGKIEIVNPGRNCIELEGGVLVNQGVLLTDFPEEEAIVMDKDSLFTKESIPAHKDVGNKMRSYSVGR